MAVEWIENWSHFRDYRDLGARYTLEGDGATLGNNIEILPAGGPTTMPSGAQSPRTAPGALRFKGGLGGSNHARVKIELTARDRYIVGFNFYWEGWNANHSYGDDTIMFFRDEANNGNNLSVQLDYFGDQGEDDRGFFRIEAGPGGADHYDGNSEFDAGNTEHEFFLNQWYYLEFDMLIGNGDGAIEFRRDGVSLFKQSGLDTAVIAQEFIDEIHFSTGAATALSTWGNGAIYRIADLHIVSPGGGGNETGFLYPAVVDNLYPNADTAEADFTPQGGGTNVAEVDESPQHDFDTTYNDSNTATHKDRFTLSGSVPESGYGRVMAVQVVAMAKDDADTGTRTARVVIFENSTEGVGTTLTLTESEWQALYHVYEDNPDTSAAWLMADVEASEIGYELVS
jgi:hypothetical protein